MNYVVPIDPESQEEVFWKNFSISQFYFVHLIIIIVSFFFFKF